MIIKPSEIKTQTLNPIEPTGDFWNLEFNIMTRQLEIKQLPVITSGDNNSTAIFIKTPRICNSVDVLDTNCILKYKTSWDIDGFPNEGQVDLTETAKPFGGENDAYVIYTWVPDEKQTCNPGVCTFSIEFIQNLDEDPYQNQARFYLTKSSDQNGNYLEINKEYIDDIQKRYWALCSEPAALPIQNSGQIAKSVTPSGGAIKPLFVTTDENKEYASHSAHEIFEYLQRGGSVFLDNSLIPTYIFPDCVVFSTILSHGGIMIEVYDDKSINITKTEYATGDTIEEFFNSYVPEIDWNKPSGIGSIANRTHYSEITTSYLLYKQNIRVPGTNTGNVALEAQNSLNLNATYSVYIDGNTYTCKAYTDDNSQCHVLGDGSLPNNMPFVIYYYSQNNVVLYTYSGTHSIEVSYQTEYIKKLDSKYLPEMPVPKVEININNGTGINSLYQSKDTGYSYVAIKSKNPNAYALDNSLTDKEPIGAIGDYTSSFGGVTSAQGKRAAAFGTNTVAKGKYSFACGDNSVTLGNDSFACGLTNVSYGTASFSAGSNNIAKGNAAAVFGTSCQATGDASFSGGSGSEAIGTHSFTFGNHAKAGSTNSVAFGVYTETIVDGQFVCGKYNSKDEYAIFMVGCGADNERRKNALALYHIDGKSYLTIGDQLAATENYVEEKLAAIPSSRKFVSGEMLEINNLDNPYNAVITSTVTDNYFYKKNYIVHPTAYSTDDHQGIFLEPLLYLQNSTTREQIQITPLEGRYTGGFVNYETGYILFRTPSSVSEYDEIMLDFAGTTILNSICELKPNCQYLLIIKYDIQYDHGYAYYDITLPYLVDYDDAYHWVNNQEEKLLPCPYTIMLPHKGRIDKRDTLTIEYETSDGAASLKKYIDDAKAEIMEYIKSKIG